MPEEGLLEPLVRLVLAVRAQYLAAYPRGALKHWQQIQSRLLAAARRTGTAAELSTDLMRGLQIGAPSRESSLAIEDLGLAAQPLSAHRMMTWIERNHALVMARARLAAEARQEARKETHCA